MGMSYGIGFLPDYGANWKSKHHQSRFNSSWGDDCTKCQDNTSNSCDTEKIISDTKIGWEHTKQGFY